MNNVCPSLALIALLVSTAPGAEALPKPLVTGLQNPESVAVGADGRIYVSTIGEFDKDGDGAIVVVEQGKAVPFATGLDDPKGIVAFQDALYVADKNKVWRIARTGEAVLFVPPNAFPTTPLFLNDIAVDAESGTLFVSDSGNLKGEGGAVYRINPRGLVDLVINKLRLPELHTPNGLLLDGASHLLLADFGSGVLYRIKLADGKAEKLAEVHEGVDGLAWDRHGRLFISNWKDGRTFVIPRPGDKPVLHTSGLQTAADLCLDSGTKHVLVPDMKAGTVSALRAVVPGAEVDESPLPLVPKVAFPDLSWAGWKAESDDGKPVPLRPIVLTHAGDGSNRVFVATEQGVIHVFPNDQKAPKTTVFLDLQDRVRYRDDMNEEGFLGMAFHPRYKQTGEIFVFYTAKTAKHPHTNIVSRFRVRRDNPEQVDPASEEVLLRVEHPYWNHDGGTICFGPDGFLYVALGDGGAANDPLGAGQDLTTLLGKVLRIDVDRKQAGGQAAAQPYAIPKDNPFVSRKDARPEIWCSGLRNVWRFSFDRKTGACWAADVGQNLFEEINLLVAGGNYGWNLREALHPFGARGVGPRKDLIEPIWEYHHDTGKSITGGFVYRGKLLPELAGSYVYADYVSGALWALRYDEAQRRVVANRPIPGPKLPVLSFGEDEQGELYFLIVSPTGKGIYGFTR